MDKNFERLENKMNLLSEEMQMKVAEYAALYMVAKEVVLSQTKAS